MRQQSLPTASITTTKKRSAPPKRRSATHIATTTNLKPNTLKQPWHNTAIVVAVDAQTAVKSQQKTVQTNNASDTKTNGSKVKVRFTTLCGGGRARCDDENDLKEFAKMIELEKSDVSDLRYQFEKSCSMMMAPAGCVDTNVTCTSICRSLAGMLSSRLSSNSEKHSTPSATTPVPKDAKLFESYCGVPNITPADYLERIATFSHVSGEAFLIGVWRVIHLQEKWPKFPINPLTVHRLVLTSIMVSAKFFDDTFISNGSYAMIGGIHISELNILEVSFLKFFNFDLYCSPLLYANIYKQLVTDPFQTITTTTTTTTTTDHSLSQPLSPTSPLPSSSSSSSSSSALQPSSSSTSSPDAVWPQLQKEVHSQYAKPFDAPRTQSIAVY